MPASTYDVNMTPGTTPLTDVLGIVKPVFEICAPVLPTSDCRASCQ